MSRHRTPPGRREAVRNGSRRAVCLLMLLGPGLAACGDSPQLVLSWDAGSLEAELPTVIAALRARSPQHALAELDRLEAAGSLPEGALHYRALALGDIGRTQDAIATWNEELSLRPGNGRAHALLARLLVEGGELDEAAQHLDEARRHAPDFPLVLLLDGRLSMLRDDDERARRSFRDFLMVDPYGVYASEAYHALGQIAARRGPEGIKEARELDKISKGLEQVHGYLARYEDRLREDPQDITAAFGVATAFLNLYENFGRDRRVLDNAEQAFVWVVNLDSRHAKALYNLGYVQLEQNREQDARVSFQAAIEADPEFAAARINLGTLLLKMGELDAGMRELERALSVARTEEDRGRTRLQLGRACERIGTPERLGEAIDHYRHVMELLPGDPMHLEEVIAELERRLGIAPSPAAAAGEDGATPPDGADTR